MRFSTRCGCVVLGLVLVGLVESSRAGDAGMDVSRALGVIDSPGATFTGPAQSLQGAAVFDVSIEDIDGAYFNPPEIIIEKDMIVRWTNNGLFPHTSTSEFGPGSGVPSGLWDSGVILPGGTYERTFDETIEGVIMQGAIDVRSPADATGDRIVDFNDLLIIAQHYGLDSPDLAFGYGYGDFTFDGVVDFNDLLLVAQHYGDGTAIMSLQASGASVDFQQQWTNAVASIPEPMMGGFVALGTLMARRRRA